MSYAQTPSHDKRRFFVTALAAAIATLFFAGAMPALANSQLAHLVDKEGQTIATFDDAAKAIEAAYAQDTTLVMDKDWTISSRLCIADGETITIDMNDHVVSGVNGSFLVGTKSNLTLTSSAAPTVMKYRGYGPWDKNQKDCQITTGGLITGGDPGSCEHGSDEVWVGGITVCNYAVLTLDGVSIAGNKGLRCAGAVRIHDEATLNMKNGATIERNTGIAGGITVYGYKVKINMEGSSIKENYGDTAGGGITSVADGTEISMTKGSEISNNTSLMGGGICFSESYFKVTSEDSTGCILGNQTTGIGAGDGGGVLVESKIFGSNEGRFENITFSKNTARRDGGALELNQEWTRVINCTFTDNTSAKDGGAIFVDNDDISIEGCTIRENACDTLNSGYEGGGIFVGYRYDIKMTGVCVVKDNCRGGILSGNKDDVFLGTISGSTGFAYITGGVDKGSSVGVRTGIDTKDRRIGDKINNATQDCFFMDMSKFHVSYGTDHGGDMWQRLGEAVYTLKMNGTTIGSYKQGAQVALNGASSDSTKVFKHWAEDKSEGLNPFSDYIENAKSQAAFFTMPAIDVNLVADYVTRAQSVKLSVDAPKIDEQLPTTGTLEWEHNGTSHTKTVKVSWLSTSNEKDWTPASGAAQPGLGYKAIVSIAQDLENDLAFATNLDVSKQQVVIGGTEVGASSASVDSSGRLVLTTNSCSTEGFQVVKVNELSMKASKGETKEEFLELMPTTVKAATNKKITLPLAILKDEIDLGDLLDASGKVKMPEQGDTVELEVPVSSTSTVYVPEDLRTVKLTVKVSSAAFEKVDEPTADPMYGQYSIVSNPDKFDAEGNNFIVNVACDTDGATIKYNASYLDGLEEDEQSAATEATATDGKLLLPVNKDGRRAYSVELWAEKNESESCHLELYYLVIDNSKSTVRTVSIEYADTAMEGQHGSKEAEQYKLGDGESFSFAAPYREGYVFEKWQKDGVDVGDAGASVISLDEVTADTTLTAVYNPVISSLSLGVDIPTAHSALMGAAESVKVKAGDSQEWNDITSYFGDGENNPAITWTPGGDDEGNAEHDTVYTAILSLAAGALAGDAKYVLADDIDFYVNEIEQPEGGDAYIAGEGDSAKLCVEFPETVSRAYKELAAIEDIELTFAQACGYQNKQDESKKASWGLPKEIQATYQCGETEMLDVEWETVSSFDKEADEAQEVTVTGKVDYPSYVDSQGAPETITATLKIAKPNMYTVTFDTNGGTAVGAQTVKEGSRITMPDEQPTKTGRVLYGWVDQNGSLFNAKTPITSDITLHAQWGLHLGQVAHLEDEDGNELGCYTDYAEAVQDGYNGGIVVMDVDWTLDDTIRVPAGKSLTIDMDGHKMSFIRTFVDLGNGANVTLTSRSKPVEIQYSGYNALTGEQEDQSITTGGLLTGADLEACKDSDGTIPAHPNVIVGPNATLTLDGVAVAGNKSPKSVGGASVEWKGVLNMKNGASIEHNYGYSGGVDLSGTNSTLNMENSSITGNYAYEDGGGVKCSGNFATINMSKDSKINNNGARCYGGGVGISGTDYRIQSSDGKAFISGNHADKSGGGINVMQYITSQNEGHIQNITIADNVADVAAGGLLLGQEWARVIDCTFTGNTAAMDGGAIFVDNDDNSIEGCTITGNACDTLNKNYEGGGVFVGYRYDINMLGKCIVKNNCRGSVDSGNYDDVFLSTISGSTGFAYITGGVEKGSSIGVRTGIAGKDRRIGDKVNNATTDCFFMDLDGYYVSYGTDHGGDMWQRNATLSYLMQLNGQDVGRYVHNAQVTLNGASTDPTKVFKCWSAEDSEHLYPFEDYVADVTNPQVTFKMPGTDANLVAEYTTRTNSVTLEIDAPSVGQALPTKGTIQWTYDGKGKHKKVAISWLAKDDDGNWAPARGAAEYAMDYKAVVSVTQDVASDLAFALSMAPSDQKVKIGGKDVGASEVSVDANGTLALASNVYTTDGLEVASVEELAVTAEEGTLESDFLAQLPSTVKAHTAKGTELALDVVTKDADLSGLVKDGKVAMPASGDTVEIEVPVESSSSAIVVPQELSKTKLVVTVTEATVQTPDVPTVSSESGSYSTADDADKFKDGSFALKVACSTEGAKIMHTIVYRDEDVPDGKTIIEGGEVGNAGNILLPLRAKGKCMYSVELWAEKDGMSSSKLQLNYVLDDTASAAKYTVTVKFADTAADDRHESKDPETYQVTEGDAFSYTAPQRDGFVFEKWIDANGDDAGADSTIQLDNVTANAELTAVYNPVVSAIDVYFDLPQADSSLSQTATQVKAKVGTSSEWIDVTSYFTNGHDNPQVMWSPEGDADGKAAHDTAYTAMLALASGSFSSGVKYVVSDTATLKVNGGDVNVGVYTVERDGVTYLCIDCPVTGKYEYKSFEQPDAVDLTYDQALTCSENLGSNWGLPESMKVNYACGETGYVPVRWTGAEGFNKDSKGAQELKATGVLQFPSDVSAQTSATVTCVVNVAAPGKVADVEASDASGAYLGSLKVKLVTQTEGATIRYTLDGSEPTEESTVYSGAIKIKHNATLKAKAFRENMQDGDTAVFEYVIEHEVTFDSAGGSAVEAQRVVDGELAAKPADPTMDGYEFKGWYTEDGEEYSFETPVTGDVALEAQWEKSSTPDPEYAKSVDVQLPEVAAGTELPDSAVVELTRADGKTKVQVNATLAWLKADGTALECGAKAEPGELEVRAVIDPSSDPAVAYDASTVVTFGGKTVEDSCRVDENGKLHASFKVTVASPELDKVDISQAVVKLASAKLAYLGKWQRPKVTSVMLPDGTVLADGTDYTISGGKGKNVGEYELTIVGVGNYAGTATAAYKIVPAKVFGLKTKATGKGKIKVCWKKGKIQRSGVQLRYAASKAKLKKNKGKSIKVKGASAKSKTLKRLKAGKRCYFKVRAYKVVNGKKYYSAWSKVKSIKVKRK